MNVELFAKDVVALLEKHGVGKSEFVELLNYNSRESNEEAYEAFNHKQGQDAWKLFGMGGLRGSSD